MSSVPMEDVQTNGGGNVHIHAANPNEQQPRYSLRTHDPRHLPFTEENIRHVSNLMSLLQGQIKIERTMGLKPLDSIEFHRVLNDWLVFAANPTTRPIGPWTSRAKRDRVIVDYSERHTATEDVLVDIGRDLYYVPLKKEPKRTLLGEVRFYYMGTIQGSQVNVDTRRMDHRVAIKMYLKNLVERGVSRDGSPVAENPPMELDMQQRLSIPGHKNVCPLLSVLETETEIFAVLPYLDGAELYEFIATGGAVPESAARNIMHQMLSGVNYIHQQGVAHRDLSPENFMYLKDGTPVVIDFGTCCTIRKNDNGVGWRKIPHTGPIGKRFYMCPSVYHPLESTYDATAADAWSVGVTFFALLTAKPPFTTPWSQDKSFVRIAKEGKLAETFWSWKRNGAFNFELSNEVLDLLQRLITARPQNRLSIEGALQHPFFLMQG